MCVVFFTSISPGGWPSTRRASHRGALPQWEASSGKAGSEEHAEVTLRQFDEGADACTQKLDEAAVMEFCRRMGNTVLFEECVVDEQVIER